MKKESKLANDEPRRSTLDRRGFLAGAGAAAFSFSIIKPELVRGSQANSKIALGMIGCGGRGTWIADLFRQHGGYEIVAAMDYFQDKVNPFGEKYNVAPERRYSGLRGYRRMLEGKLDAVAIESPPYFHPEQAAAAVDAAYRKPILRTARGAGSSDSARRAARGPCFGVPWHPPAFASCYSARRHASERCGGCARGSRPQRFRRSRRNWRAPEWRLRLTWRGGYNFAASRSGCCASAADLALGRRQRDLPRAAGLSRACAPGANSGISPVARHH